MSHKTRNRNRNQQADSAIQNIRLSTELSGDGRRDALTVAQTQAILAVAEEQAAVGIALVAEQRRIAKAAEIANLIAYLVAAKHEADPRTLQALQVEIEARLGLS